MFDGPVEFAAYLSDRPTRRYGSSKDMPRKPALTAEEKGRLILELISGARTLSDAARAADVSTQSVVNWRKQFIDAGVKGFAPLRKDPENERRIRELDDEVRMLKVALAEAHLALRAIKRRVVTR
ncbi:transposase [Nocardia sp. NPDC088792]|uniref:transposase n=1 Tax=Nocardia sp. NPDC088792 TaxID=3364332 RepID=UPI003810636F